MQVTEGRALCRTGPAAHRLLGAVLLSFIVVTAASCATEVFPVEKEPVHGESVWGVYLVTDDDPSYSTASATAIDRLTSCLPSWPGSIAHRRVRIASPILLSGA